MDAVLCQLLLHWPGCIVRGGSLRYSNGVRLEGMRDQSSVLIRCPNSMPQDKMNIEVFAVHSISIKPHLQCFQLVEEIFSLDQCTKESNSETMSA